MTDFGLDAAVEVRFFEDLKYGDVAPVLDALADTSIFNVRATRDAWSGPAAGGPEVGLIVAAVGGIVAAGFFGELGKDAYKGVRTAILAVVRRLHERRPEKRRAVVGLAIHVRDVSVCFGPILDREPLPEEWTDEWFVERLQEAQLIFDRRGFKEGAPDADNRDCDTWLK
jgi:hypothetical protein